MKAGHKVHFFDSTGGLRGFKRSYYEGGVRSPSVVRWPGVTPAGSVSNVPWAFWDVLPTLLEMANARPLPANATIDGRSIVKALRGEAMAAPAYLYWTWRGAVAADEAPEASGMEPNGMAAGAKPRLRGARWQAQGGGPRVRRSAWQAALHGGCFGAV